MLTAKHQFKCVHFGNAVLSEVVSRGLEITPVNERIVREELRARLGMNALAILNYPTVDSLLSQQYDVTIDGLYSMAEYTYLKEHFPGMFTTISIHASRMTRKKRLVQRKVRPLTPAEVDERDYFEITRLDKGGPIAIADFHIVNDSSLETLLRRVKEVIQAIPGEQKLSRNSETT